jgi:hypothetical protein
MKRVNNSKGGWGNSERRAGGKWTVAGSWQLGRQFGGVRQGGALRLRSGSGTATERRGYKGQADRTSAEG